MRRYWHQLTRHAQSLQGRIVASVGVALLLILSLFVLISLWALEQGTEGAFQSRVVLATIFAERVDETLDQVVTVIEHDTVDLTLQPGSTLSEEQRRQLDGLRRHVSTATALSLLARDGTVLWQDAGDAGDVTPLSASELAQVDELPPSQAQISALPLPASALMRIQLPIELVDHHVGGVLVAEVDPRHPSLTLLPGREPGQETEVALISRDGRFIAGAPDTDGPFQPSSQRSAREHARLIVTASQAARPGYLEHTPPGSPAIARHVVAYAPLALVPGWIVTVEQPTDLIVQLPDRLRWYLAVLCGTTLGLIMMLAYFDVRRILRPIRSLTTAAERLAAGQFGTPIPASGADELGDLSRAFEGMRVRLRDSLKHEQDLAVLGERERIAGEMHDGLGQVLGYVITKSLAVAHLMDVGEISEARAQIDQLDSAAREAYADVRENILALRTTLSPDRDLVDALREYIAGFQHQSEIAVDLHVPGGNLDRWVEPTAQVQLLRIVQEALTNVRKHAGAHQVTIRLKIATEQVTITIQDDGRGFDIDRISGEAGASHFGLRMMCERAEAIGGTLTIASEAHAGARITVTIPRRMGGETRASIENTPRR